MSRIAATLSGAAAHDVAPPAPCATSMQVGRRHHLVDEAVAGGFGSAPIRRPVSSTSRAMCAGSSRGRRTAAVVGQDAERRLGQEELGVVGGDDEVGAIAISKPPPTAMPFTAAITGVRRPGEIGEPAEAAGAVVAVERLTVAGGAEVPTGAEEPPACAGEDGDADGGVVLEADEHLAERLAGGRVDGVGLRAVECHDGDAVGDLDMESTVGHVIPPRSGARRRRWHLLLPTSTGLSSTSTTSVPTTASVELHDEFDERIDVGGRSTAEAGEQRCTAQRQQRGLAPVPRSPGRAGGRRRSTARSSRRRGRRVTSQPTGASRRTVTSTSATTSVTVASTRKPLGRARHRGDRAGERRHHRAAPPSRRRPRSCGRDRAPSA